MLESFVEAGFALYQRSRGRGSPGARFRTAHHTILPLPPFLPPTGPPAPPGVHREVLMWKHDPAGANRAFELLDRQLDKLAAAPAAEEIDGLKLSDFVVGHRDKLANMHAVLKEATRARERRQAGPQSPTGCQHERRTLASAPMSGPVVGLAEAVVITNYDEAVELHVEHADDVAMVLTKGESAVVQDRRQWRGRSRPRCWRRPAAGWERRPMRVNAYMTMRVNAYMTMLITAALRPNSCPAIGPQVRPQAPMAGWG